MRCASFRFILLIASTIPYDAGTLGLQLMQLRPPQRIARLFVIKNTNVTPSQLDAATRAVQRIEAIPVVNGFYRGDGAQTVRPLAGRQPQPVGLHRGFHQNLVIVACRNICHKDLIGHYTDPWVALKYRCNASCQGGSRANPIASNLFLLIREFIGRTALAGY